jgi:hypothetical protein
MLALVLVLSKHCSLHKMQFIMISRNIATVVLSHAAVRQGSYARCLSHKNTLLCIASIQIEEGDTSASAVVTSSPRNNTTGATTTSSSDATDNVTAAVSVQLAAITPQSVTTPGASTAADLADVEDTAAVHNGKNCCLTITARITSVPCWLNMFL